MTKDPRSGQFAYFRTMPDPWAGISVPVDITAFLSALRRRPFFLSFLYAVMRAANAVPELRRRLLPGGQVVEYDRCDPSYTATTDHTREYVPLLVLGKGVKPGNLGTKATFADIAATVTDLLGIHWDGAGTSFAGEIL